jgi:hypothetical protein
VAFHGDPQDAKAGTQMSRLPFQQTGFGLESARMSDCLPALSRTLAGATDFCVDVNALLELKADRGEDKAAGNTDGQLLSGDVYNRTCLAGYALAAGSLASQLVSITLLIAGI